MAISASNVGDSATALSASLVSKIQNGDQKAEAEFVAAYSSNLMLMLLQKTQDPDLARDCSQKTMLIALDKMRAGDILKPESIYAFLRSTAANVVITHHRTEERYTNLGNRVFELQNGEADAAIHEINSDTIKCLLKKLLAQLPIRRDRDILTRFYLREEDKVSLCRDFAIKSEHFDRVLYRAKQRVRLILEDQEGVRAMLHDCLE